VSSFYVQNFGCRATQADGAAIERQFQEQGLDRAESSDNAQVVVLNTCTVTASADQDARAAIRRIHRNNPGAQIVVTGCYAQRAPEEISALPGVSQVIGNSHKHRLAEILQPTFVPLSALRTENHELGTNIFVSDIFAHTELLAAPVFEAANQRTRPNLKVQDGCDNRCSFCVIPSVRGQSRSLPLSKVVDEINTLVDAGYREVVISGINLGRWGKDFDCPQRFEDMVRTILSDTSLEKLRVSSVEPMDWSEELIELFGNSSRIARHAHVPMQSGSDAVLRRMHRKYRPWHYREKIEAIREAMPNAAIGADVMVGFPGETEVEFEETRRMIEDLPLTYLHVFTYSVRPETPAAEINNQVQINIARDRNHVLRALGEQKKLSFMRGFVGTKMDAITLNVTNASHTEALTDNYLKLRIKGMHKQNQWLDTTIERVEDGVLVGIAQPQRGYGSSEERFSSLA
jgi:threonylcarbamoyladenosine tRNA methylthiotransferase MtaB